MRGRRTEHPPAQCALPGGRPTTPSTPPPPSSPPIAEPQQTAAGARRPCPHDCRLHPAPPGCFAANSPITIAYRDCRNSAWTSRRTWSQLSVRDANEPEVTSCRRSCARSIRAPMLIDPVASTRRASGSAHGGRAASPLEVFPTWRRAQLEVDRLAREAPLAPCVLRTTGFLRPELAERVTDWFIGKPTAPTDAVRRSYGALERETARLFEDRPPSSRRSAASVFECNMPATRAAPIATQPSYVPSSESTGR